MASQEDEIAVKTIRKRTWKEQPFDIMCWACKKDRETVARIMLVPTEHLKRCNGMMRAIYCYRLHTLGFAEALLHWNKDDYGEKVKENDSYKLSWD